MSSLPFVLGYWREALLLGTKSKLSLLVIKFQKNPIILYIPYLYLYVVYCCCFRMLSIDFHFLYCHRRSRYSNYLNFHFGIFLERSLTFLKHHRTELNADLLGSSSCYSQHSSWVDMGCGLLLCFQYQYNHLADDSHSHYYFLLL